ncbi:hypothetical protein AgCh_014810 [Apium graveolens]
MKTRTLSSLAIVFLVFIAAVFLTLDAHPLNDVNLAHYIDEVTNDDLSSGLYITGIKAVGGPSERGVGHEVPNLGTPGDIGPSDGANAGEGHEFTNAETLGERKESGPAPGGEGH